MGAVPRPAPRESKGEPGGGLFARLDVDRDGAATPAEFDALVERRSASAAGTIVGRPDLEGDGRISLAELISKALAAFDRLDTNATAL